MNLTMKKLARPARIITFKVSFIHYVYIFYFSCINLLKFLCIGCGYNKNGKRCRTSDGLNNDLNYVRTRRNKTITARLNTPVDYINIPWAKHDTNDYIEAIEAINDCYIKMLMIGKCREVFRLPNNKVPELLSSKTKSEFNLAKINIERRYNRYADSGGIQLKIRIPTFLVPDPRKYSVQSSVPIQRRILVREEIINHEFDMKNINMQKCEICLELHMVDGLRKTSYTCQKCYKRKDPMHYLSNNLHPVWYEVSEDGQFVKDVHGNKVPHFEIPLELKRLSMAEKFLIRRCSNYVPMVHLSNGVFALKGHCVTFPQDISEICNELPLRRESMVVFIRYLGNKNTTAVYPKSLRVNRQNVLNALLWLKRHNPLYSDISIVESNLDWMEGEDEVSISRNAKLLWVKNSKHNRVISKEDDFVSPSVQQPPSHCIDIDTTTMHANEPNLLPGGKNADIIRTFRSIAQKTGQDTQIMKFPPIDHETPIKYV
jgi:hypothetical protein